MIEKKERVRERNRVNKRETEREEQQALNDIQNLTYTTEKHIGRKA